MPLSPSPRASSPPPPSSRARVAAAELRERWLPAALANLLFVAALTLAAHRRPL